MNTAKEQFKNDLQKDPEDLEREADSVREDIEGTVDELMQQFSPSELLNRGISLLQSKGNYDFLRNLSRQVENNPIPTILAGVSLIWLMTASKQPSVHRGDRGDRGESVTDTIGKKAGATREKLSSATSSLRSSSHDAAERTREAGHRVAAGASDAMHRVSDASRHTAESARSGLRNAREGYTQMLRDQPLLVGVLAVAAGAALGALLPRTSVEDRVMGELSDRETDAFKEKAEEKLQEAQGKAAPESADDNDVSSGGAPSPKATNKPESDFSGGGNSPAGTDASQSDPKPPQLDPTSAAAARDSSKAHPGTD
ncbi:hypothetical protein ACJO5Y_01525 [Marinobacter sp. GN3S48]|uniref:hypothetical protein n=1 Tax=Marinobacter sp. GN3S48 TaxID=3382302 RepID=UPI00387AAEEF